MSVVNDDGVPFGWAITTVENLAANEPAAITDGPFGSNLKSDHYTEAGPRVIRLQNIGDGCFLDEEAHISESHFATLRKHEACAADVVVAMLGEELPRACLVPDSLGPAIVKADCVRLRVHPDLAIPEYVVAGLNSQKLRRQAAEVMHGVGRPRLGLQWFRGLHFPVAPLREQRRIVESIESYFSRLDDAVATLERAQRNLKRYRASVLKSAVEGRLVPTEAALAKQEGRDYEPASVLLGKTEAPPRPNRWNSRSEDVILGHAALAVGHPKTPLPEGWAWSALVDIARMESGHTPSREHPEWWDGDVPWIGIADAREHHGRVINATLQHTNSDGLANSAARLLPPGTVCISRTASVGYVVVMGCAMATSQDFVNWIPTGAVTSDWLRLIFSTDREVLRRFGKGSVHKTIYFPEWLSVHIAVPPLKEQVRIVAEADRLLSVADGSYEMLNANLRRCDRLRQSILKWAFEGKLADQDPSDEPASALLARIKAERDTTQPAKKKSRA